MDYTLDHNNSAHVYHVIDTNCKKKKVSLIVFSTFHCFRELQIPCDGNSQVILTNNGNSFTGLSGMYYTYHYSFITITVLYS